MKIYAIADLHLSKSVDKPMDIFGTRWSNYMNKIEDNWVKTVNEDDLVIIPGDISWAMYLDEAYNDFSFIHSLPGKKVIIKGNHDYWWTTMNKLNKYMLANDFNSISFIHNNCFYYDDIAVCGTRGWKCPGEDGFNNEDKVIYDRELGRLEMSLKSVNKEKAKEIFVMIHFPPYSRREKNSEFIEIMKKYNVNTCVFGHIHKDYYIYNDCYVEGIKMVLASADFLQFVPILIKKTEGFKKNRGFCWN